MEWPLPKSFNNIQKFLEFANFYHCFIDAFSRVAASLSDMLKGGKKSKFKEEKFVLTKEAKEAFEEFKQLFTIVSILVYYNLA